MKQPERHGQLWVSRSSCAGTILSIFAGTSSEWARGQFYGLNPFFRNISRTAPLRTADSFIISLCCFSMRTHTELLTVDTRFKGGCPCSPCYRPPDILCNRAPEVCPHPAKVPRGCVLQIPFDRSELHGRHQHPTYICLCAITSTPRTLPPILYLHLHLFSPRAGRRFFPLIHFRTMAKIRCTSCAPGQSKV